MLVKGRYEHIDSEDECDRGRARGKVRVEGFKMLSDIMGDGGEPGTAISRKIAKGESVEHELNAMIQRRHQARVAYDGERLREYSRGGAVG
jgi:hypothetical protein